MAFDSTAALAQVREAQSVLDNTAAAIADEVYEGRSADGQLKVKLTGDLKVKRVLVKELPEDGKELEGQLAEAVGMALAAFKDATAEQLSANLAYAK